MIETKLSEKEKGYFVADMNSETTRMIQFRFSTPYSVQLRIAKRFQKSGYHVQLYSDKRLSIWTDTGEVKV